MVKHLKGLEINTIYDFDNAFSINELLCKFWEKIEETINISNESIDILDWVKNTGLSNETKLILEEWRNNGTLTQLINIDKFNEMKEEFTELVNQFQTNCNTNLQNSINSVNNSLTEVNEKITQAEESINTNTDKIEEIKLGYTNAVNSLSTNIEANYVKKESYALNTVSGNIVGAINEINDKATPETQNAMDGFRKFYDGLIVQWGNVIIQSFDYTGSTNVVFPRAFGTVYNVVATCEDSNGLVTLNVKNREKSQFTVEAKSCKGANDEHPTIGAVRVNWVAIGGEN